MEEIGKIPEHLFYQISRKDPSITSEVLHKYRNSPSEIDQNLIASHPNTSKKTLRHLFAHSKAQVSVAGNKNTPPDILDTIIRQPAHMDEYTLRNALRNPNIKHSTIDHHLNAHQFLNKDYDALNSLASNPSLKPSHFKKLFDISNTEPTNISDKDKIHYAMAQNPSTPSEILTKISNEPNSNIMVFKKILIHPNLKNSTAKYLVTQYPQLKSHALKELKKTMFK